MKNKFQVKGITVASLPKQVSVFSTCLRKRYNTILKKMNAFLLTVNSSFMIASIILIVCPKAIAQNFDFHTEDVGKVQEGYDIIETISGDFIFVGVVVNGIQDSVYGESHIIRLNKKGEVLWKKVIDYEFTNTYKVLEPTDDDGCLVFGTSGLFSLGDLYILKLNADGTEEWTKSIKMGIDQIIPEDVLKLPDGSHIVVGDMMRGGEILRMFILKLDPNFEMLWIRKYIYDWMERANSVDVAVDGGFIIGGDIWKDYNEDIYLVKTDSLGFIEWSTQYGEVEQTNIVSDWGQNAIVCADGNIAVSGMGIIVGSSGGENLDQIIVKTDLDSNVIWENRFQCGYWGGFIVNSSEGGIMNLCTDKDGLSFTHLNQDGEIEWQKKLFLANGIIHEIIRARVTQSGGYMIVGNLNLNDGNHYDDPIFAVVTDKNGNITSEFSIDFERPIVKVFPNPATDYVNFSFSGLNGQGEEMELRIFMVNGKGVYQNKFTNSIAVPINKGMEEKGIYLAVY